MRIIATCFLVILLTTMTACGGGGSSPIIRQAPTPQQDAGLTSPLLERYRDYLYDVDFDHFGDWIMVMEREGLDTSFGEFAVFGFPISPQYPNTHINEITNQFFSGQATYMGVASGMYTLEDGTQDHGFGEFLADVEITADFERPYPSWVSGQITDFKTMLDQPVDPSWAVDLRWSGSQAFGGNQWTYEWYDSRNPEAITAPQGIGGTFGEQFDNGHVTGAFGATRP